MAFVARHPVFGPGSGTRKDSRESYDHFPLETLATPFPVAQPVRTLPTFLTGFPDLPMTGDGIDYRGGSVPSPEIDIRRSECDEHLSPPDR